MDTDRAADDSDDRIPIAMSSETPVERWGWDGRYLEVLDHSPGSVDLERAADGLPFLLNHSTRDQIGLLEDVRLDDDRVLRALARFSKAARAQEIRQDIEDGIRKKISVGYSIDPDNIIKSKSDDDAMPTVRVMRWTPLEASSVPIPADNTVGVGRAEHRWVGPPNDDGDGASPEDDAHHIAAKGREETTVDDKAKTTAATDAAVEPVVATAGVDPGNDRVRVLSDLAERHNLTGELPGWLRDNRSVDSVKDEILERANANLRLITHPVVDLTEREKQAYSLSRAILQQIPRGEGGMAPGFEMEVSQAIESKLPSDVRRYGGFFMPTNIEVRAGLDSKTSAAGGALVFDEPGAFIDLLRNRMKVRQLGATVLSGLNSPITFAKQATAGTFTWVGENPGSDVSESALSLTTVVLTPKTGQSTTSYSKQLLAQDSYDTENLVRSDLASIHALGIDLAAINGSGTGNEPEGILNTTGIGDVPIGTNGGAPTYAHIVDLETAIAQDNADIATMAYLSTAVMRGKLKKTEQFSSTNGMPVWTGGREGEMNGYPAHVSNQVPADLVKGTSSDCHAIIMAVWSQLLIGEWGTLEILVDPYALKKQGMIEVTTFQMIGLAVRYAEAFAAIQDARNV